MKPFARRLALLGALAVILSPALYAKVTKATLSASPKSWAGDCPKKIVFNGSITVDAPGTVTYVFTRSDGATDTKPKTLKFTAAGTKNVAEETWTLGGPSLSNPKGWEAIKVTAPNAFESNHANFQISCDPPMGSAKAAHGNTDWHIDTANEFLFGTDMSGTSTAANFAPSGWTKTHIHTGQTNAAHFYNDASVSTPGDDANGTNGIDKPMLFFYAGHGNATTWNALGTNGHQTDTLLGNPAGSGQLRYYWQCSCEVFAHGPRICPGGTDCDYPDPAGWDGSADSSNMRNVFERWGPAIGPDLRMACGVSTLAYCHQGNVNAIWDNFNNKGFSVADSFIDGLGSSTVIPLCITRGGSNIANTPLYDDDFTNNRNAAAETHLHILYAGGSKTEPPPIKWTVEMLPKLVKLILVDPIDDPVDFRRKITIERDVETFRDIQFAGGAATVRRQATSGAVYLKSVAQSRAVGSGPSSADVARRRALDFARRVGWLGDDEVTVTTKPLRTASVRDERGAKDIVRGEKGTIVTLRRRIRTGDRLIDVLGQGGRIDVEFAPNGEVLRAARTWRKARPEQREVPVKPFERALEEAQRKLANAEAYKLGEFRFGYKEDAGNVRQRALAVVYEFDFVPRDFGKMLEFPPQRVEVPAVEQ
jgi:hypothetical protein